MAVRLLHKLLDGGESTPIAAFVSDDVTRQIVGETAAGQGAGAVVKPGGPAEASTWLSRGVVPKVMVVDFSGRPDPLTDAASLKDAAGEGTQLIAIGQANDITLYRALLRLGYLDYLPKPISPDVLKAALAQATAPPRTAATAATQASTGGRTIVVLGARGGVGSSTVAVNTAWIIAEELDRRSALLDLDLQFGTASLSLNLAPSRGLSEALLNPDRIDQLFVASAMVTEGKNLAVLAAEDSLERASEWDPAAVEALVGELKRGYDWIWVDLPRSLASTHRDLLASASHLVLVSDLSLAGMRDTLRLLAFVRQVTVDARIVLVVNRIGAKLPGGVTRQEFEKAVEAKIDVLLPDDPQSLGAAASIGKTLPAVAPKSKLVAELRSLARLVIGTTAAKKSSAFGKLFGR